MLPRRPTDSTSPKRPIPAAPMRTESHTLYAMEIRLISREVPVSRAVLKIKRFFLTMEKPMSRVGKYA